MFQRFWPFVCLKVFGVQHNVLTARDHSESQVIRDIHKLNLRASAKELAVIFEKQIDLPVLYIIDSDYDQNYSHRHPRQHNQFVVTAKPQTEQSEFERLILSGLYRGIQDRRRHMVLWKKDTYLLNLKSTKQIVEYRKFIGALDSFVSTFETNLYLKQYEITTSQSTLNKQLNAFRQKLQEYIEIKSTTPCFKWYREVEVSNLLVYGKLFYKYPVSKLALSHLIAQVNPYYFQLSDRVVKMLSSAESNYDRSDPEKTIGYLNREIISIFHLEKMVELSRFGDFYRRQPLWGQESEIFSFIPEDFPRQDNLVLSFKLANSFLSDMREISEGRLPEATVNLARNNTVNGTSDTRNGNQIILTDTLLLTIADNYLPFYEHERLSEVSVTPETFFHYIIYFVVAHEYAHILNGDCSRPVSSPSDQEARESRADSRALSMVKQTIFFNNRAEYSPEAITLLRSRQNDFSVDSFNEWTSNLSVDQFYQVTFPAAVAQVKCESCGFALRSAFRLVQWLRSNS